MGSSLPPAKSIRRLATRELHSGHRSCHDAGYRLQHMGSDDIKNEVARLALPLLVERLGGVVEITQAEYDAFEAKHGKRTAGIAIEWTGGGFRLTIVHVERPALS